MGIREDFVKASLRAHTPSKPFYESYQLAYLSTIAEQFRCTVHIPVSEEGWARRRTSR